MNIVRKKIRGHEYVYLSSREGSRVVHKYLGRTDSPAVASIIAEKAEASGVPENLSSLFWDTNRRQIHLRRHARYVIERVLELGWLDAVSWLQRVYPVQRIIDVLTVSRAITPKSREFWKIWFGVRVQDA
jgi:hypothetical protein